MIKRYFIFVVLSFYSLIISAQKNLVPNGDFENYKWLPTDFLGFDIESVLVGWNAPTNGTPDYFYNKTPKISGDAVGFPIDWSQYSAYNPATKEYVVPQEKNGFCGLRFGVLKKNEYNWNIITTECLQTKLLQKINKNQLYKLKIYYRSSKITNSKFGQLGYIFTQTELRNKYATSINNPFYTRFNPPILDYTNFSGSNYDTSWQLFDTIVQFDEPKNYLTIGGFNIEFHPYTTDTFAQFYFFVDNISLVEMPSIQGPDTVCVDETVNLTSTYTGPFIWSSDRIGTNVLSNDSIYKIIATKSRWFYLIAASVKDSLYITVIPKPWLIIPKDTFFCDGNTVRIFIKTDASKVVWNTKQEQNYIDINKEGIYKVTCSNIFCSVTDSVNIIGIANPTKQIPLNAQHIICPDDDETIQLNLSTDYHYIWLIDKDTSNLKTFYKKGCFPFKIFNSDKTCSTMDSLCIDDICNPNVFIPNAFAPNGINKTFKISVNQLLESKLLIFNLWGEKIYESTDLNPEWDGTYKNSLCPQGNYFYSFTGTVQTKKGHQDFYKKGTIFLVR